MAPRKGWPAMLEIKALEAGYGETLILRGIDLKVPEGALVAVLGANGAGKTTIHVPEGRKIFPNLNVREVLELGSYRRARANRARNLERVFGVFPRLKERTRQAAGTLSGGEQQMLAIGRGLMAEPKLLILDEPSLGLSPLLVEEMFTLIRRLHADGLTIMLVEQNVAQSLEVADQAHVLENGVISLSGAARDIAADPELRRSYLGL